MPFSADFPGFLASLRAKQVEAVSKMSSNVSFVPKGLASTASQASESSFISSLKPTSKPSGSVGNKVSSISRPNVDKQVLPSKVSQEDATIGNKYSRDCFSDRQTLVEIFCCPGMTRPVYSPWCMIIVEVQKWS